MERLLISGGAGFLGRYIIRSLTGLPYQARILDMAHPSLFMRDLGIPLPRNMEYFQCDLTKKGELEEVCGSFDALIHLARSEDPARSGDLMDYNGVMTENLAALAEHQMNGRLVLASSFQVYGANAGIGVDENALCMPLTPYAASKLASERIFSEAARRTGAPAVILRYFNIYGQGAGTGIICMLKKLANTAASCPEVILRNDGQDIRDYIFAVDAAKAAIRALCAKTDSLGTINIGTGRPTSVKELIIAAATVSGKDFQPVFGAGTDPIRSVSAGCRKMKVLLGMESVTSLEDGLRQVFGNRT